MSILSLTSIPGRPDLSVRSVWPSFARTSLESPNNMVMAMMIITKECGNDNVSLMMTMMIMIKMMLTAMTKVQPEASQVCRAMSCSEEVRPGKRIVVMVGPGALYVVAHFYMNICYTAMHIHHHDPFPSMKKFVFLGCVIVTLISMWHHIGGGTAGPCR